MLDLGCDSGYFCHHAAAEFDCVAVGVDDDDFSHFFATVVMPWHRPRTIFLHKQLSIDNLHALAQCERFDVVLALNFLHHFESNPAIALAALDEIMDMGDAIVIETPPPDDYGACGQGVTRVLYDALSNMGGMLLAMTPSHTAPVLRPMWLFGRPVKGITKAFMGAEGIYHMVIDSNYERRIVTLFHSDTSGGDDWRFLANHVERRDWIAGINLWTYLCLGGKWPTRKAIGRMLRDFPLPAETHGDMKPWNFILDGERIHLIDGRDEKANFKDAETLAETIKAVEG